MKAWCLLALLALPTLAAGRAAGDSTARYSTLVVDANFFSRGEFRVGGLAEGDDNSMAGFILGRSMLGLNYERPVLSARLTCQHSGTWGMGSGTLSVYEAWLQIRSGNGFFARLGRQNLSYDDQRIFGSDDWAMTGRSHDVLKLGYEGHGHSVHLIGAWNQNPENMNGNSFYTGGLQPYKAMQALWYHYDVPGFPLGASLMFMNVGMQGSGAESKTWQQQMMGTFVSLRPAGFYAEAAFYYQTGHDEHGIPISAWMASAKATASLGQYWKVRAGYDYLSGDSDFATPPVGMLGMVRKETVHGFSSIYGSHHKFYGAMDFFYVTTYYGGFTPGLQNLYAGGTWSPSPKISLDASYHFLATATKLQNAGMALGHEVETSFTYNILKDARLGIGYTFMGGTETMVLLKRTGDRRRLHWAWIMLTISPELLRHRTALNK